MPNRDRTGPAGLGPLTGRGLGPCVIKNRIGTKKLVHNLTKRKPKTTKLVHELVNQW